MKAPPTLLPQQRTVSRLAVRERLGGVAAWIGRADVRTALAATLGLRFLCSLIAALAVVTSPGVPHPANPLTAYLSWPWLHWDTAWYLEIAQHGYTLYGSTAFLPLYPLLTHALGVALGDHFLLAALVISTFASFGVFLCLYRLIEKLSPVPQAARWALLVAALLPVSFFLMAGYTEALFLWAALGALLAFLEGRWARMALLAIVATLTRHQGLLLSLVVVPTLASILLDCLALGWKQISWRAVVASLRGPLVAGMAGPLAYLGWLLVVGLLLHAPLPWEPLTAANGWNLHTAWPGVGVLADLAALARQDIPSPLGLSVPLDALAAILAGITILAAIRRLPMGILLYVSACWCLALVKVQPEGLTISAARYLLSALPLAILPGELLARSRALLRLLWVILGSLLLFFLTWEFTSGGWIN